MIKLTDTQMILLASAANRDTGSLLPLPVLKTPAPTIAKSLAALKTNGFAEEREVTDPAQVHRIDGDLRFGLFITAAGMAAIGLGAEGAATDPCPARLAAPAKREPKSAVVLGLLKRDEGATLAELIEVTGWLPHTTRAALTGIRKKGVQLEKSKRGDLTCYRAVAA